MERGRTKTGKTRHASFSATQDHFTWFKFTYPLCYSHDECNLFPDIVSYGIIHMCKKFLKYYVLYVHLKLFQ